MMAQVTISDDMLQSLRKLASEKTRPQRDKENGEDFNPYDWAGGNIDDAYYQGEEDGEISLAQDIIAHIDEQARQATF
jgi:hypothetical protein